MRGGGVISRLDSASRVGLGMALAASLGAGCRAELAPDAVQDAIAEWLSAEGIPVDAVRCPRGLTRAAGESVECAATLGPEVVEVTARVVDDDGALSLRPRHATVVAARAVPEIAQTLRAQGYAVADVRCDGQLWVARAGAEQRCEVTDAAGRRFAWRGVWSGEGTHQRVTVMPLLEERDDARRVDDGGAP